MLSHCSICGKQDERLFWHEGNNALPVNDGRCCDQCDKTVVLLARMDALRTYSKEELIQADFGIPEIVFQWDEVLDWWDAYRNRKREVNDGKK